MPNPKLYVIAGPNGAGKLMIQQIYYFAQRKANFGFETTLSGKRNMRILKDLKQKGYMISMFYLWLPSVEMAIQRVKTRVKMGGHSVPEVDIRRRYKRGLNNFRTYKNIVDQWQIVNGAVRPPASLAFGKSDAWTCEDWKFETLLNRIIIGPI